MKKISTLLLAAASVALAANAADLTPVEVTLANPSFEETDQTNKFSGTMEGWDYTGSIWTIENFNAYNFHNNNASNGAWSMRCATNVTVPEGEGNYLGQTLTDQPLGTYVLSFEGQVSRDGWKQNLSSVEGAHGYAFIIDELGDPDVLEGESISYTNCDNIGNDGNNWYTFWRIYVVHTTNPELADFGSSSIQFGFGFPATTAEFSKAAIACDNFHLRYFDTMDTQAVKDFVNAEINDLKAGKLGNEAPVEEGSEELAPVPYAINNPGGRADKNFNYIVKGVVTNSSDSTSGITDVATPAVKDNKYYNLQGIEIAKPTTAGLYIHNGKKYIVK